MHIGNAMTVLLAWLQMRSVHGELILRIEDIDTQRSKAEYAEQIMCDLNWLGLDWDEGPQNGGPYDNRCKMNMVMYLMLRSITAKPRLCLRLYHCTCHTCKDENDPPYLQSSRPKPSDPRIQ